MSSPTKLFHFLFVTTLLLAITALVYGLTPNSVVDANGSGNYKTVQEAINDTPKNTSKTNQWVIFIKNGVYKEHIYVQREKRFITLLGEDANNTVLTFNLYAGLPDSDNKSIGTFRTPSVTIDADDFTVENIRFENSAGPVENSEGRVGQALAIRVDGDRVVFRNCQFFGWQDTILLNKGRQYFEDSLIVGHYDFIFGGATAFFSNCHIHCVSGGYITAASTPIEQEYGFVFYNSTITGASSDVKTYLGRPWRAFAAVMFINTEMSEVVRAEGWNNWSDPKRENTTRFYEFGSTGARAKSQGRVNWAHTLSQSQANQVTVEAVLGGNDGWNPL